MRPLLLLLILLLAPGLVRAESCEALAAQAGEAAGVPAGLLPAIARVEAGRGPGGAWPWTLNQGGKGMFFETRAEAVAKLREVLESGVTNIDVGCMQLNHRWHSAAFPTLDEMIDPVRNTTYAARFLVELKARLGSWEAATAAYHSTDPSRGGAYLAKVSAARSDLGEGRFAEGPEAAPLPDAEHMQEAQMAGILVLTSGPMVALAAATGPDDAASIIPSLGPLEFTGAAAPVPLTRDEVPPRLQAKWEAIRIFRTALAGQP